MKDFSSDNYDHFARYLLKYYFTSILLPSSRSNYFDSVQTRFRRQTRRCFIARTIEDEGPLTETRIPAYRPWGWFSMDLKREHELHSRKKRGKKSLHAV